MNESEGGKIENQDNFLGGWQRNKQEKVNGLGRRHQGTTRQSENDEVGTMS